MNNSVRKLVGCGMLLSAVLFATAAPADVKLPSLFSDNMVLQRGVPIRVWGWAEPGEEVLVQVGEKKARTSANSEGRFEAKLPSLDSSGPITLTIQGKNEIALHNVVVGEVWVCSGQSNMFWPVGSSKNARQEIADANYPNIRLFTVPIKADSQPQQDVEGSWVECSPETVERFSAVAYFFGRDVHKSTGQPVGLIHTSIGGSPVECWMSTEMLRSDVAFQPIVAGLEKYLANKDKTEEQYRAKLEQWKAATKKAKAEGKKPPAKPSRGLQQLFQASGPYNAMIAPLMPFAIRGAIWYQGESNASRAKQYQKLFRAMIRDWRRHWGEGEFPFLFVQLANFKQRAEAPGESDWAELREAQTMALALPNTGMAVTIDVGEAGNIHPANKQAVGERLALAASAIAYGGKDEYSGPIYESASREGNRMRIHFQHVGNGLLAKGEALKGFAIAGADRHFVWADAEIDGSTVVVSSKDVTDPAAVRYAWADNPACNLYNREGLPASPFRTDDWPTKDNKPAKGTN